MRLVRSSFLMLAALLAGCGADRIQGLSPSASGPSLDRDDDRSSAAFAFTTIDVPGAVFTSASGINARGDIVGTYRDGSRRSHGFLLRGDEFSTIDFPGSTGTEARGIGPNGEIVGTYSLPGEPAVNSHGYLRTKTGDFIPVNAPGHTNTIVQRILPDGTLLGCRHDGDLMASMRGITIGRRGYEEISQFASMQNGGTPDGRRTVGLYTNETVMPMRTEGYLLEDGEFTPFLVPGSTFTAAWDMNSSGEIVGVYGNLRGAHGFVREDDEYVSLDAPGATATRAFGINSRGDVVGSFVAGGKTHGFVARRDKGR